MKLSVIIVNYNVQYFLEQCLESVFKAKQDFEIDVYVVDNNSKDLSVEMVKEKFPQVHLIANKDNPGFSKANNQAIKISKAEYVLLLNPDTVVGEDTFQKSVDFMDEDKSRGGLGIKMVDGKGIFLPESKRGLPTPKVAFYKIFGLSSLFSKSKKFGKYHLSYLSKDKNHEVDVLSGAFMLMRKETLNKCGLLDETFFMYGEDIDLSYRIIKEGYKNVYFSDSEIIHYKGESTKKGSINYVFVFYKAMIIFAKKHFQKNNAFLYQWTIYLAIYLRAFLALVKRFFQNFTFPLLDVFSLALGFLFVTNYWEKNHLYVVEYPDFLYAVMLPIYIVFWLIGLAISGAYNKQKPILKSLRGIALGTIVILLFYALLPENLRTSRALILLGSLSGGLWIFLSRTFFHFSKKQKRIKENIYQNIVIASAKEEFNTIKEKRNLNSLENRETFSNHTKLTIEEWNRFIDIHQITEIIFSDTLYSNKEIISLMGNLSSSNLEFKISLKEKDFIIGSNSIHQQGKIMKVEDFNLLKPNLKRSKRILDILSSLILFVFSPILFVFMEDPIEFLKNIFYVLFGELSWVGYSKNNLNNNLPKIKEGILSPSNKLVVQNLSDSENETINFLYAKNYEVEQDVQIMLKNWRKLGNKIAEYTVK